jgi:hypothetical protein
MPTIFIHGLLLKPSTYIHSLALTASESYLSTFNNTIIWFMTFYSCTSPPLLLRLPEGDKSLTNTRFTPAKENEPED